MKRPIKTDFKYTREYILELNRYIDYLEPKLKPSPRNYIIVKKCNSCKKSFTINVNRDKYYNWLLGTPIQVAIPSLTSSERELLISGTCGNCYDELNTDV